MDKLLACMLPEEIYLHFEFSEITESSNGFGMRLEEYAELVPSDMEGINDVVLDGFCNPFGVVTFFSEG